MWLLRRGSLLAAIFLILSVVIALNLYIVQRAFVAQNTSTTGGSDGVVLNTRNRVDERQRETSLEEEERRRPVVAYATTITKCGAPDFHTAEIWRGLNGILDPAAVLRRSVETVSYPANPSARYGFKMYAIFHVSDADSPCAAAFRRVGYEVVPKELPVPNALPHFLGYYKKLNNESYRLIEQDGCCGERELLKLSLFELVDHPVVVHLDLDTLVVRPLDDVLDMIVLSPKDGERWISVRRKMIDDGLVAPTYRLLGSDGRAADDTPARRSIPTRIDAFYTRDWASTLPRHARFPGVQGGFFIARPSVETYRNFTAILQEGNFVMGRGKGSGWGGAGYGRQIEGAMTFQGIVPYYYDRVAPNSAVELHMCRFNQMATNPRMTNESKYQRSTPLNPAELGYVDGTCRDGRGDDCDDVQCQTWKLEETWTIHYTICKKPWVCTVHGVGTKIAETCKILHEAWFRTRRNLDEKLGRKVGDGEFLPDRFHGYCNKSGQEGYQQMTF